MNRTRKVYCLLLAILPAAVVLAQAPPVPALTPQQARDAIAVLPGYKHERLQGIDSVVGRITSNRLEIRYDIGAMAGNRAVNPNNRAWFKEQVVGGNRIQVAMSSDHVLTVTLPQPTPGFRGGPGNPLPANFWATIKTDEDVADLILTALTYRPN